MLHCQRPTCRMTSAIAALIVFAVFAPGSPAAPRRAVKRTPAKPSAQAKKPKLWTDALTQFENGPGVLVCDPVPIQADAPRADFGAGCGRWLHLFLAGHGELGKTPRWSDQEITRKELARNDMRLTSADLTKLAHRPGISLGITHIALGEISGSASECTLN